MLNNNITERWSPAPTEMKGTVRGVKRRPRHVDVSVDRDPADVPAPVSEPVCSPVSSEGRHPEPVRAGERALWTHWTSAEEQTLRQCYEEGTPIKEIAQWMGLPAHAVYAKAKRMGLTEGRIRSGTRWTPEDIRILIECTRKGMTTAEIIARLGVPRNKCQILSKLKYLKEKGYDIPNRSRKGKIYKVGG